jgi:hypothetical protein
MLALMRLGDVIRSLAGFVRRRVRTMFLVLFWIIMISVWSASIYLGIIFTTGLVEPIPPVLRPSPTQLKEVRVYDQDQTHYGLWERQEAIKFSLDQVDSSIKYLFVGAAAILGYVLKILIEPQLEPQERESGSPPEYEAAVRKPLTTPFVDLLLLHAALGSIISIACGFYARLYLQNPADSATFSIYGEIQYGVFGQLMSFFVAALLMIWAAITMVLYKGHKSKENM